MFPGGEANFGQETYWSLERPPQVTLDGFDLYSSQASIAWPRVDLTRPLQRQQFRPLIFEFSSSVFTKAAGLVSLAGEGSLVSISETVLFPQASCVVFGRIRGKVRVLPLKQRLVHVQLYFTHLNQPLTINNTIAPITHLLPIQTLLASNSTTSKYIIHNALF